MTFNYFAFDGDRCRPREERIDIAAYRMWLSDCDADPMLHVSWQSSKDDYRRRAEVAAEVLG